MFDFESKKLKQDKNAANRLLLKFLIVLTLLVAVARIVEESDKTPQTGQQLFQEHMKNQIQTKF